MSGEAIRLPPHIRSEKYSPSDIGTPVAEPFKNMHAAANAMYISALLTFILIGIPPFYFVYTRVFFVLKSHCAKLCKMQLPRTYARIMSLFAAGRQNFAFSAVHVATLLCVKK